MIGVAVCALAIVAALASVGVLMAAKVRLHRLAQIAVAAEVVASPAPPVPAPAPSLVSVTPAVSESSATSRVPATSSAMLLAGAPAQPTSTAEAAPRPDRADVSGPSGPVRRATPQPNGWRLALVGTAAVVLLGSGFVIGATRDPRPDRAGALTPVPVTVATTEAPPAGTTTEPSADATSEPAAGAPTSSSGLVTIAEGVDDVRAIAVAATLDTYFGGINTKDIDRVAAALDPAGSPDPANPHQMSEFARATATVTDSEVVLESLSGPADAPRATVAFRSSQAPGQGPRERPAETCTQWVAVFTLHPAGGAGYRLYRSTAVVSRPC